MGMSAFLTTAMANTKPTTEAVAEAGLRSQPKVMIGGTLVRQRLADEIGADGHVPDAAWMVALYWPQSS